MKAELIKRINNGQATDADFELAERLIATGELDPIEMAFFSQMQKRISQLPEPDPSREMSVNFYKALADESSRKRRMTMKWSLGTFVRLAFGVLLLAAGFWIGGEYNRNSTGEELRTLAAEVNEMKEMMMLSMLDQQSTSQRLKAVNIVNELPDASNKVCEALLSALKYDDNANVRRAALEALLPYMDKASVREGIIEAISEQDSPMVILAISEVMAAVQEKAAVSELQKLVDKEETPEEIKERLRDNINTLI